MLAVDSMEFVEENDIHGVDDMFVTYKSGAVTYWLSTTIKVINTLAELFPLFCQGKL